MNKCTNWCRDNSLNTYCDNQCEVEHLKEKLAEAREAIKEHKRRKESWGFEGADYDKDLWEIIKEDVE